MTSTQKVRAAQDLSNGPIGLQTLPTDAVAVFFFFFMVMFGLHVSELKLLISHTFYNYFFQRKVKK
jgi:hypothetical protein